MENEQADETVSGISLKGAYLLLQELKRYPRLPTIEQMATILEEVLNYGWAVRIILTTEEEFEDNFANNDGVIEFSVWAKHALIGSGTPTVGTQSGDVRS